MYVLFYFQKALKVWSKVVKSSTDSSASLSEAFSSLTLAPTSSSNTVLSSLNQLSSKKCKKSSPSDTKGKPVAAVEDDLSSKSKDVTSEEIEEAKVAWSQGTPVPLRARTKPV